MAEENKIENEMLTDDELDKVAGGNMQQSYKDKIFLQEIGAMRIGEIHFDKPSTIERAWAQMGVTVIEYKNDYESNKYFNNGKQISRMEALGIAARKMKSKVNILDYDI